MCQVTQKPGTLISHFRRLCSRLPWAEDNTVTGFHLSQTLNFPRWNWMFICAVQQRFPEKHSVSTPSNNVATKYMCLLNPWEMVSATKEADFLFTPNKHKVLAKSLQSCPTPCNSLDCSLPSSSVHGILQVGILEWVAISFSRGSSGSRHQTQVSCISCIGRRVLYHQHHLESPSIASGYG